jgi:hypothetical protein
MNTPDYRSDALRRCDSPLRAYDAGCITGEELAAEIFDSLLRARISGQTANVEDWLKSLPRGVLSELLTFAESHPEPRLLSVTPGTKETKEAQIRDETAAVPVYAYLVKTIQDRLSDMA